MEDKRGTKRSLTPSTEGSPSPSDAKTPPPVPFEFAQRLFGELNRAVLGPPGDGKIIVLSDSDEEEVSEEKTTTIEDATAFTAVNPASTSSVDADGAPAVAKTIIVMIRVPIMRLAVTTAAEMTRGEP
jgi:hypothetical protein